MKVSQIRRIFKVLVICSMFKLFKITDKKVVHCSSTSICSPFLFYPNKIFLFFFLIQRVKFTFHSSYYLNSISMFSCLNSWLNECVKQSQNSWHLTVYTIFEMKHLITCLFTNASVLFFNRKNWKSSNHFMAELPHITSTPQKNSVFANFGPAADS